MRNKRPVQLIVTCEHGGNRLPARYRALFPPRVLESHRGYDPGAITLARELAARLRAPLHYSLTSRLLVDLNRALGNPTLFSAQTLRLPIGEQREILERHYFPHWSAIENGIAKRIRTGGRVVHLATHSFTPRLNGVVRETHVGLLFDPARPGEAAFCEAWQRELKKTAPKLRVRFNYPYLGSNAGLVGHLRRRFPADAYVALELEVNQRFSRRAPHKWRSLRAVLIETFTETLRAS